MTGLNRSQLGSLYKPKTISVAYSEDKSDAKIFCIPDFETIQQLAPDIQLEMPRHSQLGNAVRDLVANNSGTSVSYGDQGPICINRQNRNCPRQNLLRPHCISTVNTVFHYKLFNFAARQNIDLVWRDNRARVNFFTYCFPLSCKYRSDDERNTSYGVPVVEASIPSKSSGTLND